VTQALSPDPAEQRERAVELHAEAADHGTDITVGINHDQFLQNALAEHPYGLA